MPNIPPLESWLTGESLMIALNTSTALFAMLAALFWYQASIARVIADTSKAGPNYEDIAMVFPSRNGDAVDLMATLRKGNQKNASAAVCAACAAGLQAALYFIPAFQKFGLLPLW